MLRQGVSDTRALQRSQPFTSVLDSSCADPRTPYSRRIFAPVLGLSGAAFLHTLPSFPPFVSLFFLVLWFPVLSY